MKKLLIVIFCLIQISAMSQQSIASNSIYVCRPGDNSCDDLEYKKSGKCHICNMELITKGKLINYQKSKEMTIAFYLQEGVEILDFAGPLEVFTVSGFKVFIVSKTTDPIVSQGVLKVIPDYSILNAPKADILAFFGGNGQVAAQDSAIINWIKKQEKSVDYLFSVCTGAFFLGQAGVLDNQTVTTFHMSIESLKQSFPKAKVLSNVRFVDNGKIITTAGISAGIDGALHLVEKIYGKERAKLTSIYMEYDKWVPGEGLILSKN
ncbi:MAG: transcriptional regulator GlxA family with amidase domain [Urechidicola sp.]|jgi:transcriptional regulator GlxA family with amidase domain